MLVLLHLFTLFLLVGLGFYVFVADPRRRSHQTFAAFIAFLAFWTTKDLIFWDFYHVDATVGPWIVASFLTALAMQLALVVFSWVFPENARTPRRRLAVIVSPSLIFIPAALFGLLWSKAQLAGTELDITFKPLAYAFVIYIYAVFAYGVVVLFQKYRKYRGTQVGSQVGALILAIAITAVLMTITNIVLPFFGVFVGLPLSSSFALPGVLIYAYAIFNFRLFSLHSALAQFRLFPVAYKVAISIAVVAVGSFALFQIPIVWWAFHNGMDAEAWRRYLVFSVISALIPNLLLVLLVLRTISRPLRRITLTAVAVTKGAYGAEVDLRKTNDEIGLLANSFNAMSRKMAADIDELKRLHEQLIRTEKLAALGTLAAGVAHEVNNPLASISSLVQIMQAQNGNSPDTQENLAIIGKQIERIGQVTTDMTNFARAQPGTRKPTEVNAVIESALRLASFDRQFHDLDIEVRSGSSATVIADPNQLEQVILNILLNARDSMPDGGRLTIDTSLDDDRVMILIADEGKGIAPEISGQIFDPFFTTKPAGQGTGLGLAVCYGIVTAHDGTIETEPNSTQGTIVRIKLPIADAVRANE